MNETYPKVTQMIDIVDKNIKMVIIFNFWPNNLTRTQLALQSESKRKTIS